MTSFLAFALFTLVCCLGPGLALQRMLRLRPDPALVAPLGLLFTAATYGLGLVLGIPLLPILSLCLDLSLPWVLRGSSRSEGPSLIGALPPILVIIGVLAVTQYPLNRRGDTGDFLLDPVLPEDAAFHVGLTFELMEGSPPQVPGFSGKTLTYHFGWPLFRAAACRYTGLHPYASLTRFDNTLGAIGLALLLPGAVSALGGGRRATLLAPWLLLATDLSFLFGFGRAIPFWITSTKGSDFLFSLVQSNATVPALTLALCVVVAFRRYSLGEGAGWLVLASLFAVGTAFFKVFVAAQLLLGLGVAGLLAQRKRPLAVIGFPLFLTLFWIAAAGKGEGVFWDPLSTLRDAAQLLGVAPASETPTVGFSCLWILLSLGMRLGGLPWACRDFLSGDGVRPVVAAMAVSGWPLGLLFRISPLESPDRPQNEALYFFEQSGVLLWIFVVLAIGGMRLKGPRRVLLALVLAATTLPSTVQFVFAKASIPPLRVPSEVLEAMEALKGVTKPGDVILERPRLQRFPPPPMVFIGRRVPFSSYLPFLTQWVSKEELGERMRSVKRFFETHEPAEARVLASSLGARGLCLYGSDSLASGTSGLREVYRGERVRVYLFDDYFVNR